MSYANLLKGRYSAPNHTYFVTTALYKRCEALFRDFHTARFVVAEMRDLQDRGLVDSLAWVIMPDHLHWLFQLQAGAELSATIKLVKARSGQKINKYLNRQGPLWQKNYYEHALRRDEDLLDVSRYIVANPLRAGIVRRLADYPHWDAKWLQVN